MSNEDRLRQWRRPDQQDKTQQGMVPGWREQQPQQQAQPPLSFAPKTQGQQAAADDELTPPPDYKDPQGRDYYQAFRPSPRKCDRLEIRLASNIWQFPRYFDLRDISVDGHKWTKITLHFSFYDVFIEGRNLHHMLYALRQSRCDYIQEFKAEAFSPTIPDDDPNPTFIGTIHVQPKQPAAPVAATSQKGNAIN